MEKQSKRKIFLCNKCGEPTTHQYNNNSWECLCCESAKTRTKEQLREIKKHRKGWGNKYSI